MDSYKSTLALKAWAIRKELAKSTNVPVKDVSLSHCYNLASKQLSEAMPVSETLTASSIRFQILMGLRGNASKPACEVMPAWTSLPVSKIIEYEALAYELAATELEAYKLPVSKEFRHAPLHRMNGGELTFIHYIVDNISCQGLIELINASDSFTARLIVYLQLHNQACEFNGIDPENTDVDNKVSYSLYAFNDHIKGLGKGIVIRHSESILKPQNAPKSQLERTFYIELLINFSMGSIDELCKLLPVFNSRVTLYLGDYANELAENTYAKSISV